MRVPIAIALSLGVLVLTACSPAPTTTYTNASGVEVTVDWSDYPGSAGTPAEVVLKAPPVAEVESISDDVLRSIQDQLSAEFSLEWTMSGEDGWYPETGNGYGGESSYVTYNSVGYVSTGVPADPAGWDRVIAIISDETTRRGLGPVVLDHESVAISADASWREELEKRYGTTDPDKYWSWFGSAYGNSQWVGVSLVDVDRDQTGDAAAEAERTESWPQSISLSYGATTIPEEKRDAVEKALVPFRRLDLPEATTSD